MLGHDDFSHCITRLSADPLAPKIIKRQDQPVRLDTQGLSELFDKFSDGVDSAGKAASFAWKAFKAFDKFKKVVRHDKSDNCLSDAILSRIEDLIALIAGLSTATSVINFFSTIHLYVRTHFKASIAGTVWRMIVENFGSLIKDTPLSAQAGDSFEMSEDSFLMGVNGLKNVIEQWKAAKGGVLGQKMASVVNILIAFGFFPEAEKEGAFKLGDFTLFNIKAWDIQTKSLNFVEMCLDTLVFFMERGYLAIKHGDISHLLYDDKSASELDAEYSKIIAAAPSIELGRLDDLGSDFKDDQEFELRLENLIARIGGWMKTEKNSHVRSLLTNRTIALQKIRSMLVLSYKRSPVREAPFGLGIFGGSGVGKSSVNAILTKVLLSSNGYASAKENTITLNDADEYQSEFRSHHTAVCVDDHGNTKSDKYKTAPTTKIIQFMNNVQMTALSPIAEFKGKILIRPKIFTVTTNVKNMLAHDFSNEPVSILRRFHFHLDVKVRKEFQKPDGTLDSDKCESSIIPDAWTIDVEYIKIIRKFENPDGMAKPRKGKKTSGKDSYEFVISLKDASIYEVIDFLVAQSKEHFRRQSSFVEKMENLYDAEMCEHNRFPTECPLCKKLDKQSLDEWFDASPAAEDEWLCNELFNRTQSAARTYYSVRDATEAWYKDRQMTVCKFTLSKWKTMTEYVEHHKNECITAACAAIGVSITVFAVIGLAKLCLSVMDDQSGEDDEIDVKAPVRMENDVANPWKKVKPTSIPRSLAGSTATCDQVESFMSEKIAHFSLYPEGDKCRKRSNAIPVGNNCWLVPGHMLERGKTYKAEFQTTRRDTLGNNFVVALDDTRWVYCGPDFALVCAPNGVPNPDTSKWLMEGRYNDICKDVKITSRTVCSIIYKDIEGVVSKDAVTLIEKKKFTSDAATFVGVSYNYPRPTFPGLCMAPVIPRLRTGRILGFHLAGRNGENFGVACLIGKGDIDLAKTHLATSCRALMCHSEGTFTTSKYDIDYEPSPQISERHSSKWLTDGDDGQQPICQVIGAHNKGTARFVSNVRTSPISDQVNTIPGLERKHGKPCSRNIGKHWHRDLNLMSHPKGNFEPTLLQYSKQDYDNHVSSIFDKEPELLEHIHPYPMDYVLGGMDGVTAVDRVDLSTSMGWPLNKAKRFFIEEVERDVEGITTPVEFNDPKFQEEIDRMEDVLANGERVYPIHRGNLKDEPTKFTKDKIRVFAGCEIAFTCLVRKYYLPIIRVMQTKNFDFECAVGINAYGPQWDELKQVLNKFGGDRYIAGDYKAYDKTMTAEVMMLAFDSLIRIGERAGYTKRSITVMRGIATDISYPLYEYDGVFIQMAASNPSGHPLTVIVNNIANSFYERYAFYKIYSDTKNPPKFRDRVSPQNYGDDNAMGVHPDEERFNHTAMANVLKDVGITYTMADKEAESKPYIGLDELSFLKRGFRFDPGLQRYVAPLDIDSLSKSLHNQMRRKGSETLPDQIAADAIRGAARELFLWGKDTYDSYVPQLKNILLANDLEIYGVVPSYDDHLEYFKDL